MSRVRVALGLLAGAWALGLLLGASAEERDSLPVLRRRLLEANTAQQIGHALDRLAARLGEEGWFPDHAAFADWLGTVPDGRADHPLVRLRRGWAYVLARQGATAIPHLEAALADDPSSGLTRAYLGEALRQARRFEAAAEMLARAVECGERGAHVEESMREVVFGLQRQQLSGNAEGLPAYATALEVWLRVAPDPLWHHTLARMLLDDWARFERPGQPRATLWARAAGRHALASLRLATAPIEGQDRLAFDAAVALEAPDRESGGASERFDLLAHAYRLGRLPNGVGHRFPQVLTWLAEDAAAQERWELAHRLAHERLEISDSPQARRLLRTLPPDLGLERE